MTDRIRILTVVLDSDYRDDDVHPIVDAIRMVRGVHSVAAVPVQVGDQMNREVAKIELAREVWKALEDVLMPSWAKSRQEG